MSPDDDLEARLGITAYELYAPLEPAIVVDLREGFSRTGAERSDYIRGCAPAAVFEAFWDRAKGEHLAQDPSRPRRSLAWIFGSFAGYAIFLAGRTAERAGLDPHDAETYVARVRRVFDLFDTRDDGPEPDELDIGEITL